MIQTKTNSRGRRGYRPAPIPFTDEGGRACLRVPLDPHGRNHAIVTEHDYRAVQRGGVTGPWLLNDNGNGYRYVRVTVPDGRGGQTLLQVARLIAGTGRKMAVYYANGDRLDLRGENLREHRNGCAKRRDGHVARLGAEYRSSRRAEAEGLRA